MKDLREQAGLSQSQLANKLGITASAVAKWDQHRAFPTGSPEFLAQLCEVLGVDLQALRDAEKAYRQASR